MNGYLCGFSHSLPETVVTNATIAARVGKTAEWIEKASGIVERRWAGPELSAIQMGTDAALRCLEIAGLRASDVGMLIVSSGSESLGFPGPAAGIAHHLQLGTTPAIDLPMASAGALFAIGMASGALDLYENILIIATEKMSALVDSGTDPLDPNTAILFGDGAGAVLVSSSPPQGCPAWRIRDIALHTDGQFRDSLQYRPGPDAALRMDGLTVIMQAVRKLPKVIQDLLERNQVAPDQVGAYLLHQANLNLLQKVARTLGIPEERFVANVQRYGNTSSASMLIAASEWTATTAAQSNTAPIVFAVFGAGFHWGALLAEPAK